MTGLEKIIAEIHADANEEAERILAQAGQQADGILAEAAAESEKLSAAIVEAASAKANELERGLEARRQLRRRQRVLQEKQALLDQTLDQALQSLNALPEDAYFDLLLRLAKDAAEPQPGTMFLNARDLSRLPDDFSRRLAQAIPKDAALEIAKESRAIDGGFVLSYGGVEHNCSFKAFFDARREEFCDLAHDILFA